MGLEGSLVINATALRCCCCCCVVALRWDAEAAGTSHLMVGVMERWSEPRSSPTVHSVPVEQAMLTAVTSGVLRPPVPLFTHVAVSSLRMLAFWERSQSGLPVGARLTVGNGR